MKKNLSMALLIAMLYNSVMSFAQTPFYQKCSGEGESNLANFSIQNILPEKDIPNCEITKDCNPYYFQSLEVTGSCVTQQWLLNSKPFNEENLKNFCYPLESGLENTISNIIKIEEGKEVYEYKATCIVTTPACCDINLDISIEKISIIEESEDGSICNVRIFKKTNSEITEYVIEDLNQVLYQGSDPPEEFKVPCGKTSNFLCFTAKGNIEKCEISKCLSLEKTAQGDKIESKIIKDEIMLTCFPNPANDELNVNISIPVNSQGELKIIDFYGKTVLKIGLESGFNTKQISTSNFHAGNYLISITDDLGGFSAQKVVIVK